MKFIRADGSTTEGINFMQGPALAVGMAWSRDGDSDVWREIPTPHTPQSNPNHTCHDMHIFGYHHTTFLRKQYL